MIVFEGGRRNVKTIGNYVYIHYKMTDRKPFYVGKGQKFRAWDNASQSRNRWWKFTAIKHGVKVEICQDGLSEDNASLLEMWLIAKLKKNGCRLCNMTDGGEGRLGHISEKRKVVYCSNGMSFPSTRHASAWLIVNGHPKATSKNISAACVGRKTVVHGFCWSYKGIPEHKIAYQDANRKDVKTVYCSNGMEFKSLSHASVWVCGKKNRGSKIGMCCAGLRGAAYGLTWSYKKGETKDFVDPFYLSSLHKNKKTYCSNGMTFDSAMFAAEWVSSQVGRKVSPSSITQAITNRGRSSFGLYWSRDENENWDELKPLRKRNKSKDSLA